MNTFILEESEQGEYPVDVYQKLANDRILFINDLLSDQIATDIIATLILKDQEDSDSKISIFINSMGGSIRSAFMIYDVMQMIKAPIETICIGHAMNEAVILMAGGAPGMRLSTKNSIFSITQLQHNQEQISYANLTEAQSMMQRYTRDNKNMIEIIAKSTKQTFKKIMSDLDKIHFMTASQALKYGLIDQIIAYNK